MIDIPYLVESLFVVSTTFFLISMYLILPPFPQMVKIAFSMNAVIKTRVLNLFKTKHERFKSVYVNLFSADSNLHNRLSDIKGGKNSLSRARYGAYIK